jgi:V8-like Glu-specific endopeptidase
MIRTTSLGCALLLTIMLFGCGEADEPAGSIGQVTKNSTGAVFEDKGFPYTVGWLDTTFWPSTMRDCVVVAVAKNAVLTAGHCISENPNEYHYFTIYFGDDIRYQKTYRIRSAYVYAKKLTGMDMGVIQLDGCYGSIVPAKLMTADMFDAAQNEDPTRWKYVGYLHGDQTTRAGPRVFKYPVTLSGTSATSTHTRSHPGMWTWLGDSGSPVFRGPSPLEPRDYYLHVSGVMMTGNGAQGGLNSSVPYGYSQILSILGTLPECPSSGPPSE